MNGQSLFAQYGGRLRAYIDRHSPGSPGRRRSEPSDEAAFNDLALDLFRLQYDANAAYHQFCQHRGITPRDIVRWTDIPALPTTAFQELDVSSLTPAERVTVFHSSGTTGQRVSRHFHSRESLGWYEASLAPWFQANLLPEWELGAKSGQAEPPARFGFVALTPPPDQAPHSSLVHMFQTVKCRFGSDDSVFTGSLAEQDGHWTVDMAATLDALHRFQSAHQPVVLLGTAFGFVALLDEWRRRGLRLPLPPGSRTLETGGYKGRTRSVPKVELHHQLAAALGLPLRNVISEYGMCELSSQAYDGGCENFKLQTSNFNRAPAAERGVFRFPAWARVMLLSPETGEVVPEGEIGLVRVFDLANVASVLAVQTADLGVRRGDGFELLGRAPSAAPRGCSLTAASVSA